MAYVISNEQLAPGIFRLTAQGQYLGLPGQFYMLRSWDQFPLLSRPISIHDIGRESITFLYRVNGIGTRLLSALQPGQLLQLDGPFGNGFPQPVGRTAIVGGGMGIAPLLLASKMIPNSKVFLGYTGEPFAAESFRTIHPSVAVVTGGSVIEEFEPLEYDTIYACGPVPMMEALATRTAGTRIRLYVSVEKRMACGIGACNGCHVTVTSDPAGRKACTDGPVFLAEEVNFHDLYEL